MFGPLNTGSWPLVTGRQTSNHLLEYNALSLSLSLRCCKECTSGRQPGNHKLTGAPGCLRANLIQVKMQVYFAQPQPTWPGSSGDVLDERVGTRARKPISNPTINHDKPTGWLGSRTNLGSWTLINKCGDVATLIWRPPSRMRIFPPTWPTS